MCCFRFLLSRIWKWWWFLRSVGFNWVCQKTPLVESSVWPQFRTYGRKILGSHPDCNGWSEWLVRTSFFCYISLGALLLPFCTWANWYSVSGFTMLIPEELYLETFLGDMISVIYTQTLCWVLVIILLLILPLIFFCLFYPFSDLADVVDLIQCQWVKREKYRREELIICK